MNNFVETDTTTVDHDITTIASHTLLHPVCCITDVEPDDFLAILAAIALGVQFHSFLIVDRTQEDEWDRLGRFKQFQQIVQDIANVPVHYGDANSLDAHLFTYTIEQMAAMNTMPIVICLANYLPLIRFAQKNPKAAQSTTVMGYLSVNLRWTKSVLKKTTGETNDQVMTLINTAFKSFISFETFGAFGQVNTANENNTPAINDLLKHASHPYIQFIQTQIQDWNTHMKYYCIDKLSKKDLFKGMHHENVDVYCDTLRHCIEDHERVDYKIRGKAKILLDIHTHTLQFVFADVGLMVAMLGPPSLLHSFKHVKLVGEVYTSTKDAELSDTAYYYQVSPPLQTSTLSQFDQVLTQIFQNAGYHSM